VAQVLGAEVAQVTDINIVQEAVKLPAPPPVPQAGEPLAARVTSRKFLFALLIQVTATVFVILGKMDSAMFFNMSTMTMGIYAGSSIADKRLNPTA
jgi:hypothetical protein